MPIFTIVSAVITVVALSGYANYKLVRLPDTVGITAVALLISIAAVAVGQVVPQVTTWGQLAVRGLDFPNLVFHGLLGLLLFAGSLHADVAGLARARTVKLMTWAGLRGALSVALALSLAEGPSKELIVTATYVIAIFSILVQAPTVEPLARRWLKQKV